MILNQNIHHPNDVTNKYFSEIMPEKLNHYFKLPGEFIRNFPTKIFLRNGSEREIDWMMLTKQNQEEMLTLVEFQSYPVNKEKIKTIADCADYSKTYYHRPVCAIIIITEGYESSQKEYRRTASDIFKPIYIHMDWNEITERLNNLEAKILNQEKLTDDEALDMVFLPMFAPKNKAKKVTEKITHLFRKDNTITGIFRCDIAFSLSIMIKKYFNLTRKGKELLEMINPEINISRLKDVIDFEVDYIKRSYEKELAENKKTLAENKHALDITNQKLVEKDKEIRALKNKLKENGIEQ
ncbi:MAG: hypothetical protein E7Z80_08010 [Methanobrevibacter thaueri]|nr:hypothetical protein [Methanobrevibacter thaueri]